MKTQIIIALILFSSFVIHAQSSISVTITGCGPMSGTYWFDGIVNGKNSYKYVVDPTGEQITFFLLLEDPNWVHRGEGTLLFYNVNVPEGALPPNTGWISEGCGVDGTLVIEGGVNLSVESFITSELSIYPNPVYKDLNIDSNSLEKTYKIFGIHGKLLIEGKTFSKINISNLEDGIYWLHIDDSVRKIIKISQ